MTQLHLRAVLFVFAVCAALLTVWFREAGVGWLIILAFILGFAGVSVPPAILDRILRISGMGPQ
jgi:hypothetical protein